MPNLSVPSPKVTPRGAPKYVGAGYSPEDDLPEAYARLTKDMSMPAAAADAVEVDASTAERKHTTARSIGLVVTCTIFGAIAQILIKFGAHQIHPDQFAYGLLTNVWLLGGLACLGFNTLLLIIALREGQLSVLYPIIALTYVWVVILSPMFFDDQINLFKAIGVGVIVLGVSLIGWGSRQ